MKRCTLAIATLALCLQATTSWAAAHIRVLIVDGESAAAYHNWKATTPVLKKELEDAGIFDVDVMTAPPLVMISARSTLNGRSTVSSS